MVNAAFTCSKSKKKYISGHSLGGAVHMRTSMAPRCGLVIYEICLEADLLLN